MKSNPISKSESSQTLRDIASQWGTEPPKTKNLMVYHITDDALYIAGEDLKALKIGEKYVPFLTDTKILEKFPSIIVDMGAVKFVCNGANVMRPGITGFSGEFEAGQIVCITEESKNMFLAIGIASVPSSEARPMKKGQILENIHYVSDRYWDIVRKIN